MQQLVGIVRKEDEMRRAFDAILGLKRRAASVAVAGNREYNPGWHTALDLGNLLCVAEAVTRAAIERTESRGAQFREDYPKKDEALGKITLVIRQGKDGEMVVSRDPVKPPRADLAAILAELK
jgi:succinate dehydrogenase / fumarate reductase flavoprotein subunit